MIANVITATLTGLDSHKIVVEVDKNMSLPSIIIVGLPDTAIIEARERVRAAIKNSGFEFPNQKVIINLSPADLKKEGTLFDLAIAVGILVCENQVRKTLLKDTVILGELSLDGSVHAVNGILPIVSQLKEKRVIVPFDNGKEAGLASNIEVLGAKNLKEVTDFLNGEGKLESFKTDINNYLKVENINFPFDFKDVKGQKKAKRALEIASAGSHNVLMTGSPGSGKTLLAKCMPSILPSLTPEEAIELTKIYSISGMLEKNKPLLNQRPFRIVHHTASPVGVIGGGSNPKPGEITLAHRGVLFLDEMVEFQRDVLEVLRQPLEDGYINISRAKTNVKYPADFMLVGAMNPCPCGFLGDTKKQCTCNDFQIKRYRSRLSGPLKDRIDLQIEVPRLSQEELMNYKGEAESSSEIRKRVEKARQIQAERYKNEGILTNNQLTPKLIKKFCAIDKAGEEIMKSAIERFYLSGRSHDRVLKLARTIADLDNSENIKANHLAEALQYRGNGEYK